MQHGLEIECEAPSRRTEASAQEPTGGYYLSAHGDAASGTVIPSSPQLPTSTLETSPFGVDGNDDSSASQVERPPISAPLKSDTDLINIPIDRRALAEFHEAGQTFARAFRKLAPTRQEALLHRNSAAYTWDGYDHTLRFVRKSNSDFVRATTEVLRGTGHLENLPVLTRLGEQVANDDTAFDTKVDELLQAQRELSNAEYYMQQKEETLDSAASAMLEALGRLGLITKGDLENFTESRGTTQLSDSRAPSTDLNPLLDVYFDKAGDVGVLEDRLVELRSDHGRAKTLRELQKDQEVVLDKSDEVFEAEFRQREAQSLDSIDKAITERDAARSACLANGLDPQHYSKETSPHQPDVFAATEDLYNATMPDTPSSFFTRPPNETYNHLVVPINGFGPRNESSTFVSTETGPLVTDIAPLRNKRREKKQADERIEEWLLENEKKSSDENGIGPLCESTRPSLLMLPTRSVPDLRYLNTDTTEVQKLITDSGSHPKLAQSISEPIASHPRPISSQTLRPRSHSISVLGKTVWRHYSFQTFSNGEPP